MKSIFLLCTVLAFAPLLPATAGQPVPRNPNALIYPALAWQVPLGTPYRHALSNGVRSYIAKDSVLPLVNISVILYYGSILEQKDKAGIGTLLVRLLKSGGSTRYPSEKIRSLSELYAIDSRFTLSETQMECSFSFLSQYTDTVLPLIQQMLFEPVFEEKRLAQEKETMLENIANRFDNPEPLASVAYDKMLYPSSMASTVPTKTTIKNISRADLVKLHASVFTSEHMILSISGAFDTTTMNRRISTIFPPVKTSLVTSVQSAIAPVNTPRILIVARPGNQATVRMGFPIFKRPNPDYYPLLVLSEIYGGGDFSSRLMTKVRSDEGLAYSIHSSVESNYIFPGTFSISFGTKTASASYATSICLREMKKMCDSGVTAEELQHVKKILIDGLPSMFRSKESIVNTYAWNEYYNRPDSQYVKYPREINALTTAQINAVAKKYFDAGKFTYVIVGDTSGLFKADTLKEFKLRGTIPLSVISADSVANLP